MTRDFALALAKALAQADLSSEAGLQALREVRADPANKPKRRYRRKQAEPVDWAEWDRAEEEAARARYLR